MDQARAVEENGAEFLLTLGPAAGAEERDDGGVRWVIGNCPIDYHNAVVASTLSLLSPQRYGEQYCIPSGAGQSAVPAGYRADLG